MLKLRSPLMRWIAVGSWTPCLASMVLFGYLAYMNIGVSAGGLHELMIVFYGVSAMVAAFVFSATVTAVMVLLSADASAATKS